MAGDFRRRRALGFDLRDLPAELLRLHPQLQEPSVHRQGQLLGDSAQRAALSVSSPSCWPAPSSRSDGVFIASPADIVQTIPNTFLLVIAALALLVLTIAVNLIANFVAPIYALTNLFPRKLNFFRAGLLSAVIGLVILPWNLYDNPAVINYFLGGLGGLLGPLFGVIITDYWLIRRTKINVPELYTEDTHRNLLLPRRRQPACHRRVRPRRHRRACDRLRPVVQAGVPVLLVLRSWHRGAELLRLGRPSPRLPTTSRASRSPSPACTDPRHAARRRERPNRCASSSSM